MAIPKPSITKIYSEKRKNNLLKSKRILKKKYKLSKGPSFTFTKACRRGQFAPPTESGRPKHNKYLRWQFAGGKYFWRYLPFTKSFQVCRQQIFLSQLHYNRIHLIPIELGCVHTSGFKLPEVLSTTIISEWWVVAYKYNRRCPAELWHL